MTSNAGSRGTQRDPQVDDYGSLRLKAAALLPTLTKLPCRDWTTD
ncbi:hypothetical protein [Streptomyces sp. cg40]